MKPLRPRPGLLFLELQAESVDWDPPFQSRLVRMYKRVSKSNEEKDMKNLRGKEIETNAVAF
jgi:hypothetical protein